MLEKMSEFFEKRLEIYDRHMMEDIEAANEFYSFTAGCLPADEDVRILDLGCGTGLELEAYFPLAPSAAVTGIDLSRGMLDALKKKFPGKDLRLIEGSYFDVPLGEGEYDAAVSVESLHHFTREEKTGLYRKLRAALKDGGYFILTDYFALSDEEERERRREFLALREKEGIGDGGFYHFDTPLTAAHEMQALTDAGFASAEVIRSWEATCVIKAVGE